MKLGVSFLVTLFSFVPQVQSGSFLPLLNPETSPLNDAVCALIPCTNEALGWLNIFAPIGAPDPLDEPITTASREGTTLREQTATVLTDVYDLVQTLQLTNGGRRHLQTNLTEITEQEKTVLDQLVLVFGGVTQIVGTVRQLANPNATILLAASTAAGEEETLVEQFSTLFTNVYQLYDMFRQPDEATRHLLRRLQTTLTRDEITVLDQFIILFGDVSQIITTMVEQRPATSVQTQAFPDGLTPSITVAEEETIVEQFLDLFNNAYQLYGMILQPDDGTRHLLRRLQQIELTQDEASALDELSTMFLGLSEAISSVFQPQQAAPAEGQTSSTSIPSTVMPSTNPFSVVAELPMSTPSTEVPTTNAASVGTELTIVEQLLKLFSDVVQLFAMISQQFQGVRRDQEETSEGTAAFFQQLGAVVSTIAQIIATLRPQDETIPVEGQDSGSTTVEEQTLLDQFLKLFTDVYQIFGQQNGGGSRHLRNTEKIQVNNDAILLMQGVLH